MANAADNQYIYDEAYLADDYNGWEHGGNCTTRNKRLQVIEEQYKLLADEGAILQVQAGAPAHRQRIPRFTVAEAQRRLATQEVNEDSLETFRSSGALLLPMPRSFNFTGVIMDSNAHQGLLHTILRHSPDWVAVSSEYEAVYDSLSSLTKEKMAAIAAISKNQNRKAQLLCAAFMGYILSDMGHQDRQALHRLQTIVYNYLLKKIKEDTYSGEGVSKTGRVRIFFDAADEGESDDAGENREEDVEYMDYMVICRSEERDRAIPELGDDRQVVSVITIYFIDHKKYVKKKTSKKFG